MLKINKLTLFILGIASIAVLASSCKSNQRSQTTGWEYNTPENGGFEVAESQEQITGPGLVLIEGGTFTMGATEENPFYEWDNQPRKVTVSSFYIDQTEVSKPCLPRIYLLVKQGLRSGLPIGGAKRIARYFGLA